MMYALARLTARNWKVFVKDRANVFFALLAPLIVLALYVLFLGRIQVDGLLASLELGDATGIRLDKLLAVFEALGLSLVAQGEKIASPAAVSADAPTAASPQVCKEPRMMPKPGIRQNTEPAGISSLLSAYSEVLREIAREQGIHLAGEAI